MTFSVVLYAEGPFERAGAETRLPGPGVELASEHLGAAHVLAHRGLRRARPGSAVRFLAPLLLRGRDAIGSDLHDPKKLRQLLGFTAWRPDLAIVLVDADGDEAERRRVVESTARVSPLVVAIAVEELESWLICDHPTAQSILGQTFDPPKEPHNLARREAKAAWNSWSAALDEPARRAARVRHAETLDLDLVARRSRSFDRFLRDLRSAT